VLFKLSQRDERADRQSARVERDAVETANILEIDNAHGRDV
jgi:hypothetical protein